MSKADNKTRGRIGRVISVIVAVLLLIGLAARISQCVGRKELSPTPAGPSYEFELDEYHFFA